MKYIPIIFFTLLLCSACAPVISYDNQRAESANKRIAWEMNLEKKIGVHIRELSNIWGKPEKLKANEYRWSTLEERQGGDYYKTETYTVKSDIRDKDGYYTGSIETPMERQVYVRPYTWHTGCEIKITTDKHDIIINSDYNGSYQCYTDFPF